MLAARATLFYLLFALNAILFGSLITLLRPIAPVRWRRAIVPTWSRGNVLILAWSLGLRYRVVGRENLPPTPFVVLSKHQSAWEALVFGDFLPPFVYVLKRSLAHLPFLGWALCATGQIFVNRDHPAEAMKKVHREGVRNLQEGTPMLLFPEGTRMAPGEVGDYKAGGVGIAMAAGVPIVPIAHNAGVFWPRDSFKKWPGEVQVRIGKPIPTAGVTRKQRKALLGQVRDSIEGMMAEIGS